jgi:hypothetical protein
MVFPLLFDLCNSKPLKSPLLNDAAKAGYDKFLIFISMLQQNHFLYEVVYG